METVYALAEHHLNQLHALYQNEWWSAGRSLEQTRQLVAGSQLVFGVVDDRDTLIAFARVLTDFVCKALVFDVIVQPNYREQGLGRRLVSHITIHHQLRQVQHIELYCLPEMAEFYQSLGFTADVGNVLLMRRTSTDTNANADPNLQLHAASS